MKRVHSLVGLLLGLTFSLWAVQASANIVYGFSGVTFSDGGTLTGTFTTNDARTSLLDYDITTSANTNIGFHYTPGTSSSGSTSLPFIIVLNTPPALDHILEVTFNSPLAATGGTIKIGDFDSFEQGPMAAGVRRTITAGSAVAVPEPSTLALFGIGALGLLGLRRIRAGRA
jgi:hypothetical protein